MCLSDKEICSIAKVKDKPFASWSQVEQCKIFLEGRPVPHMPNIIQGMPGHVRRFHSRYYDVYSWLCGCASKNELYCWWCLLFSIQKSGAFIEPGYSNMQNILKELGRHNKRTDHIRAAQNYDRFSKEHQNIYPQLQAWNDESCSKTADAPQREDPPAQHHSFASVSTQTPLHPSCFDSDGASRDLAQHEADKTSWQDDPSLIFEHGCFVKIEESFLCDDSESTLVAPYTDNPSQNNTVTHPITCNECYQTFHTKPKLRFHFVSVTRKYAKYYCTKCSFSTSYRPGFKIHCARMHAKDKELDKSVRISIQCDICSEKFVSMCKLAQHVNMEHYSDITCGACAQQFTRISQLKKHCSSKHNKTKHKISQCKRVNKRIADAQLDVNERNNHHCQEQVANGESPIPRAVNDPLPITNEPLTPSNRKCLQAMQQIQNVTQNLKNQDNIMCYICMIEFTNLQILKDHILQFHFNIRRFKCVHCKFEHFDKKSSMQKHYAENHKNESRQSYIQFCDPDTLFAKNCHLLNSFKIKFICRFCDAMFKSRVSLKDHVRSQHFHGKFKDIPCSLDSYLYAMWQLHFLTAHNVEFVSTPHKCNTSYASVSELNEHFWMHHMSDSMRCGSCEFDVMNNVDHNAVELCLSLWEARDLLREVKSVHDTCTGQIPPFPCHLCSNTLSSSKYCSQVHILSHLEVNCFMCPYCRFEGNHRSTVVMHITDVHPRDKMWVKYMNPMAHSLQFYKPPNTDINNHFYVCNICGRKHSNLQKIHVVSKNNNLVSQKSETLSNHNLMQDIELGEFEEKFVCLEELQLPSSSPTEEKDPLA